MSRYVGDVNFRHDAPAGIGVLLVNLGTPDTPTVASVRRYLKQFLSDPRVVEFPRLVWWLILRLVILNVRPKRSAEAYQKIWTEAGSPLMVISQRQAQALGELLAARYRGAVHVELGMSYGQPSIEDGLNQLRLKGVRRIVILPLYPQYSGTTGGSVFDAVADTVSHWRWVPELRFINAYHDHPGYIEVLAAKIHDHWEQHGRGERLLLSFHGVPQRYLMSGDPYHCQCQKTARLVAEALNLDATQWMVVFQSRFGREPWLQPYCDHVLKQLPGQGVKAVDVVCPGFAADCLETLEEIDQQNRDLFLGAGGERYQYIPCLNADLAHIELMADLVAANTDGWAERDVEPAAQEEQRQLTLRRAQAMGAKS
jgi:ferrochelatase